MTLLIDELSERVDSFLLTRGSSVVNSALRKALGRSEVIAAPGLPGESEDPSVVRASIERLHLLTVEVCSRNSFGRLLLLFRKIRHEVAISILSSRSGSTSAQYLGTLIEQAELYGTNAILRHSLRDNALDERAARYTLQPKREELADALRIYVYALAHRYTMFFANSLARRKMVQEVSFEHLIESYNLRQNQRKSSNMLWADRGDRLLVVPGFAFNVSLDDRFTQVELAEGVSRVIGHRNYFPLVKKFDVSTAPYDYLATDTFLELWGLPYGKWKTLWAALNLLLRDSIITLWPQGIAQRVNREFAEASAERADDYADTGLGTAAKESLVTGCMEVVREHFLGFACTQDEVSTFIESLVQSSDIENVPFVEQPFLFYDIGRGRVMWDYLRHGGILRAVARKTRAEGKRRRVSDAAGPGFEKHVQNQLAATEIPISDTKVSCRIKIGGQLVWEIDLGFVMHGTLLLVEVKNYEKNARYHSADGVEVSNRIQSWESWCEKLDGKLMRCLPEVRRRWAAPNIVGAICVVCTEEAEFIASAEREYWLDFPDYPRVCTVNELVDFLRSGECQNVQHHPRFRRFDSAIDGTEQDVSARSANPGDRANG